MDDNLAVIYRETLPVSILNEKLAHKAAEVLLYINYAAKTMGLQRHISCIGS